MPLVHVSLGTICEVVLDNPPLNVVSHELTVELRAALTAVERHSEARVLILTGSGGRSFCAGSDISEFESLHHRVAEDKLLLEKLVYRQLGLLAIPTVAAIEGHALGGGLELALACDLRVASENSKLGLPELKLGVLPGSGGTQRLARVVGLARAKEIILLGAVLTAAEAADIGLVNRVTPRGEALSLAQALAETIAIRGPRATRLAKRLIDASLDRTMDEGLALELDAAEEVFASDDMLEGARAFREKRTPTFTND